MGNSIVYVFYKILQHLKEKWMNFLFKYTQGVSFEAVALNLGSARY